MRRFSFIIFLGLLFPLFTSAQNQSLRGVVIDKNDNSPMAGVSIMLSQKGAKPHYVSSNDKGFFSIENLLSDSFEIQASFIGYKAFKKRGLIGENNRMRITMEPDNKLLKEAKIESTQIRSEQKGDTTSMNASAFKVNPDATSEDLVKKMPGITVENGAVKAQGEDVKKVLVDGKEFFGDDAQMALKNMPAEVVDKVQVFNRLSDQAQFSGFNDGNTDKTMNIVTRGGGINGVFGKVFLGYGTDDRYQAGATVNMFSGNRRITLLGMSNNINQQNFSAQDLFGGSGNRGGGQRPPGMGGGGMGRPGGPGGAMSAMQSTLNNFMVGQQNGVNITNSAGFNYINKLGKKVDVSGSYFFNQGENQTDKEASRTFLLGGENKQIYNEVNSSNTQNSNHRFNLRLEYNIDTSNSILYTPRFSYQENKSLSSTIGNTSFGSTPISKTTSNYNNYNDGYSLNNNILYKRKFNKSGRTFSLNLGYDISDKTSKNYQSSINSSIDTFTTADNINQFSNQKTFNTNANANITYTEPVGKNGQLLFTYAPTYAVNESDKQTNQYDSLNSEYIIRDTLLSNKFTNTVITHRSSVNYNLKGAKYNFMLGLTHQYLELNNVQEYPANRSFNKPFTNFLPNAMFQYEFNKNKSIRTFYRTATNVPSVSQLQNVLDNSNPLILSIGNPNLKQEFSNFLMLRYSNNMVEKGKSLFLFGMINLTNNYIASTTSIARADTTINGVFLSRGSQLSRPENLDGNYNIRTFLTYATPFKKLKSNLNINAGASFTKVPGMINGLLNDAKTINLNTGFVLGSNISPKVDFNVNYTANINLVENTLQSQGNNNFLVQNAGAKINLMPNASWVFNSDIAYSNYYGLGDAFNQEFYLWNAAIGYKFLNKKVGEIRLSVFDILNQNNSINRSVTETYIEDTRTRVLNRYFMLTFTYNIRKFKMNEAPKQ